MSALASLVVDLQLETADLRKGLEQMKDQFEELNKSAKSLVSLEILKDIGHIEIEAGKELAEFVLHGAEVADQMGKMSQSAGVGVEEFSRLTYAASLSNVSTEELGAAMKKLNVNLSEAATGSGKQSALFQALGISVKDASGNVRTAGDVMRDVAEKFSGLQDGASKSALAVELFGKAGAQMIPMLNEGKSGLAEMGLESDRLGTTISDKAAKAAEEFNDNLTRLKKAVEGVGLQVASNLAPSLAQLTTGLTESDTAAKGLKGTAEVITTLFKLIASAVIEVVGVLRQAGTQFGLLGSDVVDLVSGNFQAIKANSRAAQEELDSISKETKAQMDALWNPKQVLDFNANLQPVKKSADDIAKKFHDGANAIKEQAKEQQKLVALWEYWVKLDEQKAASQFKFAGQVSATNAAAVQQKQAFANIGADPRDAIAQVTAGFKDFNDALNKSVNAAYDRDEKLAEAAELESQGRHEAARAATAEADARERDRRRASDAVEGFTEEQRRAAAELKKTIDAIRSLTMTFVSKLGEFGQVVSAAVQGFQQGGVWGALAAVLIEVLSRFEGFSAVVDIANNVLANFIGSMAPALSALTGALGNLLQAFGSLFQSIGGTLQPAIRGIATGIMTIGNLLKGFSGMFNAVGAIGGVIDAIMAIIDLMNPLGIVITLLSAAFQVVGVGMSYLSWGILKVMGAIFEGIRHMLQDVGLNDFASTVGKMATSMNDKAEALKANADAEWTKLGHIFDTTTISADPAAEQAIKFHVVKAGDGFEHFTAAAEDATKAISHFGEELTNLPQGFKYKLRSYETQNATDVDAGGRLGGGDIHVHAPGGVFTTVSQLVDLVHQGISKKNSRRTSAPNWAGSS